jgi:hypothetical protein
MKQGEDGFVPFSPTSFFLVLRCDSQSDDDSSEDEEGEIPYRKVIAFLFTYEHAVFTRISCVCCV